MKMSYFKPEYLLEHFSDMTMKWLKENKITHIFSDLDSTLAAHDLDGDEASGKWIEELKNNGIDLTIISNNSQDRVDRFTPSFGINGYGKSGKPTTKKIVTIMEKIGAHSNTSIFLGDQIFTDVLCGKRLG